MTDLPKHQQDLTAEERWPDDDIWLDDEVDEFYDEYGFRKSTRPYNEQQTQRCLADIADKALKAAMIVAEGRANFMAHNYEGSKRRDSAERTIEVIAEAGARLHSDYKLTKPDIPWREFYGMRSKISHGYDSVDYDMVWETISKDIPKLAQDLGLDISQY